MTKFLKSLTFQGFKVAGPAFRRIEGLGVGLGLVAINYGAAVGGAFVLFSFSSVIAGENVNFSLSSKSSNQKLLRQGYVQDVQKERVQKTSELKVISRPEEKSVTTWNEKIFTGKLKKEFRARYREKFGQNEAIPVHLDASRYTFFDRVTLANASNPQGTASFHGDYMAFQNENRAFGQFMIRRLAEYHIDNYAKGKEVVRKAYKLKEKMSNVRVGISKDLELKAQYKLSGNYLDLHLINPWLKNKVTMEFSPSVVTQQTFESTVTLYLPSFFNVNWEAQYRVVENSGLILASRRLSPSLSASVSGRWNQAISSGGEIVRQSILMTGLRWGY